MISAQTLYSLTKPLKAAIGAHVALIGTGCPSNEYQAAQSASMLAEQQARYLGQHLDCSWSQRAEFLELCGLRSLAAEARVRARMAGNRAAYPESFH